MNSITKIRSIKSFLKEKNKMNKKGMFGDLQQMILSLVVIGVIIGVGFLVMQSFLTNIATSSSNTSQAYVGVNKTIAAMSLIPQWLGIIVLLGIVAVLLAILFNVFPSAGKSSTTTQF